VSTARQLLEEALHLRMHGERAPGGNETWAEWDRKAEAYLRETDLQQNEARRGLAALRPETPVAEPDAATWVAAARDRNEHWITSMRLTEASVTDSPFGDLRKALAAVEALQDALRRHQHKLTDKRGDCCAGCLSDWPCPDSGAAARKLLGEENPDAT
jgi:hypothetical protein